MLSKSKNRLFITVLATALLSACGGSEKNAPPTISINPTQIEFESGETKTVTVNATDDDGTPTLSFKDLPASVSAQFSSDGKTLTLTANSVTAPESATLTIVATELNQEKLTSSASLAVKIYPKLELSALVNSTDKVRAMTVQYGNPLQMRIVNDAKEDIPFSSITSKDPSLLKAETSGNTVTLTSLKGGDTAIDVVGTLASGHKYARTLQVKTIGNQSPSLTVLPEKLSVEEFLNSELSLTITDPDKSYFQNNNLTAKSSDPSVATVTVKDGSVIVNGLKIGVVTVTVTIVDGEFTVSKDVEVTVTPETPPTLHINNDMHIELEETYSISVPVELRGFRAGEYTTTVKIVPINGESTDLTYSLNGNVLTINANQLSPKSLANVTFDMIATATNGRQTITSKPMPLNIFKRSNGRPIFEFPDMFGSNIMLKKDGEVEVRIIVNDDNPNAVTILSPEAWFNESKAGTYTMSYDDSKRTLKLNLKDFEINERFGILISYIDGEMSGKFSMTFRTFDLTDKDLEVIAVRKDAIAKLEAARSYQLIGRMYLEHLENLGLIDAQYVDEMNDQLIIDDVLYSRFTTAEFYITSTLEQVYSGAFNSGSNTVEGIKATLDSLTAEALDLSKNNIPQINDMAAKSNGMFPTLEFEKGINKLSDNHYSKFYGKPAYGSSSSGNWEYSPVFKFLSAIDEKVKENTANRLK